MDQIAEVGGARSNKIKDVENNRIYENFQIIGIPRRNVKIR